MGVHMNGLDVVMPDEDGEKKEKINQSDLRQVVKAWKITKGIPTEGPRSKAWDQANFARVAKPCKTLLLTFGDWKTAVECIDYVYSKLTGDGLTCTLETVVKRSDDFWEELAKREKGGR